MKKTDWAMIILIASFSTMIAYFVVKPIMGDPREDTATIKTIEKIDSSIEEPSEEMFNKDAINPTVRVTIGENNQQPTTTDNAQEQ